MSFLSTGSLGRRYQREEDGDKKGGPEPTNTVCWKKNNGCLRTQGQMGSRSPGDCHTGGCPPQPGPGHQRQHVSLPGQGVFISRVRPGVVSRWGSVEIASSHTGPPSSPQPRLRNRASFSPSGEPAFQGGGKVNSETNAPSEPDPLCLCHILHFVPPGGQNTAGTGKD